MRAGLEALGVGAEYLGWVGGPVTWDHATDPSDVVFNDFLPAVARMRALDPVTSELVRLRGALSTTAGCASHCGKAPHWTPEVRRRSMTTSRIFETSALLDARAKAALRYADALIWTPAHLDVDDAAEVRSAFSEDEAVELTFDVMRNASNKIAVSLGGDAPRVEQGTERYLLDVNGQTVFS